MITCKLANKITIEIIPNTLSIEVVPSPKDELQENNDIDYNIYFISHCKNIDPIFYVNIAQSNIEEFLKPYISSSKVLNGVHEIKNIFKG